MPNNPEMVQVLLAASRSENVEAARSRRWNSAASPRG